MRKLILKSIIHSFVYFDSSNSSCGSYYRGSQWLIIMAHTALNNVTVFVSRELKVPNMFRTSSSRLSKQSK